MPQTFLHSALALLCINLATTACSSPSPSASTTDYIASTIVSGNIEYRSWDSGKIGKLLSKQPYKAGDSVILPSSEAQWLEVRLIEAELRHPLTGAQIKMQDTEMWRAIVKLASGDPLPALNPFTSMAAALADQSQNNSASHSAISELIGIKNLQTVVAKQPGAQTNPDDGSRYGLAYLAFWHLATSLKTTPCTLTTLLLDDLHDGIADGKHHGSTLFLGSTPLAGNLLTELLSHSAQQLVEQLQLTHTWLAEYSQELANNGEFFAANQVVPLADHIPPTIQLPDISANLYLHGNVTLQVIANDIGSGLASLHCTLADTPIQDTHAAVDIVTMEFITALFNDGDYALRCDAYDQQQNHSIALLTLTFDNTAPVLQWQAGELPAGDGTFVGGDVQISLAVQESSNLFSTTFSSSLTVLLPLLPQNPASGPLISFNLPTKALFGATLQPLPLFAEVVDAAGNTTGSAITMLADNRGPQFIQHDPSGSGYMPVRHGSIPLSAQVSSNLPVVEFAAQAQFTESTVLVPNSASQQFLFSGNLDTTAYTDQTAMLEWRARDSAGNETLLNQPLKINNLIFDLERDLYTAPTSASTNPIKYAHNYMFVADLDANGLPDISFGRAGYWSTTNRMYTLWDPLAAQLNFSSSWFNYLTAPVYPPSQEWGHGRNVLHCDTNGDGKDDAVWYDVFAVDLFNLVTVMHGPQSTSGSFASHEIQGFPEATAGILSCADINDNGATELFVRNQVLYLNPLVLHVVSPSQNWFIGRAGNVDGDGFQDMLVLDKTSKKLRVFYGTTATTYTLSPGTTITPPADFLETMAQGVGDLNQDGYDEFVTPVSVSSAGYNSLRIFWGQASRTTQPLTTLLEHPLASYGFRLLSQPQRGLVSADFSGDGHLDLAMFSEYQPPATSIAQPQITLFLGPDFTDYRTLPMPSTYAGSNAGFAAVLETADFDLNGRADLVVLTPLAYGAYSEIRLYADLLP